MKELEIYYNNKKIFNNEFLKPNETQIEPKIKYLYKKNKYYTLIMYDPDAVGGTYIHWVVTNIIDNINNSKTILSYKGPAPPQGSGKHRYIFELYECEEMLNIEPIIERSISIELLKKKLNIFNYISKLKFISQNESGGKKKKTKKYRKISKKTRKNRFIP
jgi:phosphatidylethanolamine-binding protein (PEBP) family uncharacterized protein